MYISGALQEQMTTQLTHVLIEIKWIQIWAKQCSLQRKKNNDKFSTNVRLTNELWIVLHISWICRELP